ncbi:hypothetical protein BH24ACT2_BH24ACT2_14750 [soil metagenome]
MRAHKVLLRLLAVSALIFTGCAIPDDAAPRTLEPSGVPFSLLATSTTTTTEPQEPSVSQVPVSVYLVDNDADQLVEVTRSVPAPGSVRVALTELLGGPTGQELNSGLTSAIARSTALLGVDGPVNGVVTVNLSDDVRTIGGQGQRLALAQVVFTATAAPGVTGVLFAFEGEPSQVPDGQGQSTAAPLDRADFATFDATAPDSSPPTPPPEPAASE